MQVVNVGGNRLPVQWACTALAYAVSVRSVGVNGVGMDVKGLVRLKTLTVLEGTVNS